MPRSGYKSLNSSLPYGRGWYMPQRRPNLMGYPVPSKFRTKALYDKIVTPYEYAYNEKVDEIDGRVRQPDGTGDRGWMEQLSVNEQEKIIARKRLLNVKYPDSDVAAMVYFDVGKSEDQRAVIHRLAQRFPVREILVGVSNGSVDRQGNVTNENSPIGQFGMQDNIGSVAQLNESGSPLPFWSVSDTNMSDYSSDSPWDGRSPYDTPSPLDRFSRTPNLEEMYMQQLSQHLPPDVIPNAEKSYAWALNNKSPEEAFRWTIDTYNDYLSTNNDVRRMDMVTYGVRRKRKSTS